MTNTRADAWGTLELSGSSWLGGQGVDVFSNGSTADWRDCTGNIVSTYSAACKGSVNSVTTGAEYQCVELVNRLYLSMGWISSTWTGNGNQMYANAPSGLTKEANGSITYLNPGDVITLDDGGAGHVAIVNSVSGTTVQIVNQNTTSVYSTTTFSGGTVASWFSGYTVQGVVHAPVTNSGGGSGSAAGPIKNGGFNSNASYWHASGSANMAQYSTTTYTNPYEGGGFLAVNAAASGDSIWQQTSLTINTGDTFCAEARVVTVGNTSGGSGSLTLWLIGGSSSDSSSYSFSSLPSNNGWTLIRTCVRASTPQYYVKAQIYPTPGGPTIGVDALDVHYSLAQNGGFNSGTTAWAAGSANFTTYGSGGATSPYEDSGYGATNTTTAGGSIYQDKTMTIVASMSICVDAQVVTVGNTTGGGGVLALWLTGTNSAEVSTSTFSSLPGNNSWTPIKNCITAGAAHTTLRIQIYPTQNGPTIGVDALDVHYSRAANGSFNSNAGYWAATGSANMVRYTTSSGTSSFDDGGFFATNGSASGDSVYQNSSTTISAGDTFCVDARVVTLGTTGGSGTLALWMTGGASNESSTYNFSSLPSGNSWTPIQTCVTATTAHTNLKVQIYPTPGGPTIGVDTVDLH